MFDSPPANLPIEPAVGASRHGGTPTPTAPSGPPAGPAPMPLVKGKKEPEDIFSGLRLGGEEAPGKPPLPAAGETPKRNMLKIALIAVAVLVVLGGVGFAIWTFVLNPSPASVSQVPTPSPAPQAPIIEQPPVIEQVPAPVTTPPEGSNIPSPIPVQPEQPVTEAPAAVPRPVAPVEGADTDGDGLTDAEEALFGASASVADTDGDGYADGSEVKNLFSPAAKGEALAKSANVSSQTWNGWTFLLPKTWTLQSDAQDPSTAAISTGSLARITLQTLANASRLSLADWIGPNASGMASSKTKGGFDAMQSPDGLTTYIAADDTILVVTYDADGDSAYEYRSAYAALVQSLMSKP